MSGRCGIGGNQFQNKIFLTVVVDGGKVVVESVCSDEIGVDVETTGDVVERVDIEFAVSNEDVVVVVKFKGATVGGIGIKLELDCNVMVVGDEVDVKVDVDPVVSMEDAVVNVKFKRFPAEVVDIEIELEEVDFDIIVGNDFVADVVAKTIGGVVVRVDAEFVVNVKFDKGNCGNVDIRIKLEFACVVVGIGVDCTTTGVVVEFVVSNGNNLIITSTVLLGATLERFTGGVEIKLELNCDIESGGNDDVVISLVFEMDGVKVMGDAVIAICRDDPIVPTEDDGVIMVKFQRFTCDADGMFKSDCDTTGVDKDNVVDTSGVEPVSDVDVIVVDVSVDGNVVFGLIVRCLLFLVGGLKVDVESVVSIINGVLEVKLERIVVGVAELGVVCEVVVIGGGVNIATTASGIIAVDVELIGDISV